jgi:hypothetical protein
MDEFRDDVKKIAQNKLLIIIGELADTFIMWIPKLFKWGFNKGKKKLAKMWRQRNIKQLHHRESFHNFLDRRHYDLIVFDYHNGKKGRKHSYENMCAIFVNMEYTKKNQLRIDITEHSLPISSFDKWRLKMANCVNIFKENYTPKEHDTFDIYDAICYRSFADEYYDYIILCEGYEEDGVRYKGTIPTQADEDYIKELISGLK